MTTVDIGLERARAVLADSILPLVEGPEDSLSPPHALTTRRSIIRGLVSDIRRQRGEGEEIMPALSDERVGEAREVVLTSEVTPLPPFCDILWFVSWARKR